MKRTRKDPNKYPRGWNTAKVRRIIEYYDNQTDKEAAAEIDRAFVATETVMAVPRELVREVRRLIARHEGRVRRRTG